MRPPPSILRSSVTFAAAVFGSSTGAALEKDAQLAQGENNLGYNLFYGHYGQDTDGNFIRAGVDFMSNCTMGGAHQMDIRQECDWSDPLVMRGGTRRVVRRAFMDRTRPNVPGVHFYDEPGLTWLKHPETGEGSPQGIPSQLRSYEAAFGKKLPSYHKIDPKNPAHVKLWAHWARWKLGLMDAAWQDAQFGVRAVRPDYLSVTQSQYGFSAFTDGYYFNVVRSLPVISGHGGYHDFGPGYFNPAYFLEFARARDLSRPNWYLPTWYGSTTSDQYRLEQYLCFQTNIQGMMSPPELEPGDPAKSKAAAAIVATNHLMGRLGTIFTTMPVERPPVAVLFSLSQMIHDQTKNMKVNYAHETRHGRNLVFVYLAGKQMQQQFLPVMEEDILDGTLADNHKAIILTSLDYLDPDVIRGLEEFAKGGGLVLLTGDCTVKVNGSVKMDAVPGFPDAAKIAELKKTNPKEAAKLQQMRQMLQGGAALAKAIKPHLEKANIKPPMTSSEPGIVVTRQSFGDIEYLFAVNATHDPAGDPMLGVKAVTATLSLPDDGRMVFDAVTGVTTLFEQNNGRLEATYRFGPGQLRVFARPARPLFYVSVGQPVLRRDFTQTNAPIRLEFSAVLQDRDKALLSGSAPLRVRVLDPQGAVRYDLYRATDRGVLQLSLPLALNDPPGKWAVVVTEPLANREGRASFTYPALAKGNAAAGSTERAVYLPEDRANLYRFFRGHHHVTIVKGKAAYHQEAAERLVKILKPWNVKCTVVDVDAVNKPRVITVAEAETWIGLNHTGKGSIKVGDKNDPVQVGYAVEGPVILLGSPEDNAITKTLADLKFLPYVPNKLDLPGPGRGYLAWQRDAVGVLQESVTLIAYDAAGMSEAVGTLYELLAGIEPLTPLRLPLTGQVTPAKPAPPAPELKRLRYGGLDDRVAAMRPQGKTVMVLTAARTRAEVGLDGLVDKKVVLSEADYQKELKAFSRPIDARAVADVQKRVGPTRLVKFVVPAGKRTVVAFWGGTIHVYDAGGTLLAQQRLPQDVTALEWLGDQLFVGDADGKLWAFRLP